jgi:hypothetical protein
VAVAVEHQAAPLVLVAVVLAVLRPQMQLLILAVAGAVAVVRLLGAKTAVRA